MSADPSSTAGTDSSTNPWARWGWVMWVVWLIFLIFPAVGALQADRPLWLRLLGVGVVVLFGATYIVGAWRVMESGDFSSRTVGSFCLALLAIAAVGGLLLGFEALAFTPFLASFAAFSLPRPWHWLAGLAVIVGSVAVIVGAGVWSSWGGFLVILVSVTVGVNVARLLIDQSYDYDEVQQAMVLAQERERVARDVHDVLGHSLTVISVKAGLAERLIDVDPDRARSEIAEIGRIARESLGEVRATVGGLRAAALGSELAEARAALGSAGIEVVVEGEPADVDPAHRSVLGWVLREAVTNVVRHSRAARCRVELGPHALTVEDDGVGMSGRRRGNGLRGLEERVTEAGATFTLEVGAGGRGTRLEVSWPT